MPKSLYRKYEAIKHLARELRTNQTPAEKAFWEIVRKKRVMGMRFLRQFAIEYEHQGRSRFFIPDFYCSKARLVVEIDGSVHNTQQDYDAEREEILRSLGFNIVRFTNKEVQDEQAVIEKLKTYF